MNSNMQPKLYFLPLLLLGGSLLSQTDALFYPGTYTYNFGTHVHQGKNEMVFDTSYVEGDSATIFGFNQSIYAHSIILNGIDERPWHRTTFKALSPEVVYYQKDSSGYRLFYDFTLEIGDSYELVNYAPFNFESVIVEVMGYATELIEGVPVETQIVEYHYR